MRTLYNNAGTFQLDTFRPLVSSPATTTATLYIYLDCALILVPFKNRLLAFNTYESESPDNVTYTQRHYPFRMRYSAVGSALAANAWRQDIPGQGSGVDCPANQDIVTVEFIKDRLIVYCESSTWEIVYTGNQAIPFVWQQINTELGAESTFSIVPFDKICIGVGNTGVHACNGSNVERIDNRIPDEVFNIHTDNSGVERVYGIRDYYVEMIYWTFPDTATSSTFPYPARVLIYNYKTQTWAFNDDSITVFGYINQPLASGVTWDSTTVTWDDETSWGSGENQTLFRQVIAGNQEGYTFIIDADRPTNASVLQITNLSVAAGNVVTVTCIDHNLRNGDYVRFEGITSTGAGNNLTIINGTIFQVEVDITNANSFAFTYFDASETVLTGTYTGGGLMARVSQLDIKTSQYNFYAKDGSNAFISEVDLLVENTSGGQFLVNYYVSTGVTPLVEDGLGEGALIGTSVVNTTPNTLTPFEQTQSRFWRPLYTWADGQVIQLQFTLSDDQMRDTGVWESDFQLHALCIFAQKSAYKFR